MESRPQWVRAENIIRQVVIMLCLIGVNKSLTKMLICHFSSQSLPEHKDAQERRRQLREDSGRLIEEEAERMERDLAKDQVG